MEKYKPFVIGIFCMVHSKGMAQKIVTDRPDQTESSTTIPKKSLQIESGMLLMHAEEGDISIREVAVPSNLFRYGITKDVEIRVANQYLNIWDENKEMVITGFADLEIGAKIQLFKKKDSRTEIAILSHFLLPTGTKQLSFGNMGTINKLCFSHMLGETIGLGYNIGYNYYGLDNGFLTYSLALNISITDKAGFYIEPYGEIGIFDKNFSNIDAGMTYLLKNNFQLDFSLGTGLNYTMNYLSAGFSWNIAPVKN